MDESSFDQQGQHVGVQFNADRQTMEETVFGDKYSITVEHQTDSPRRRAASEMYVNMVRLSETVKKVWNYAAREADPPGAAHELQQLRHDARMHADRLADQRLRFRAAVSSWEEETGVNFVYEEFLEAVNEVLRLSARWSVEILRTPRDVLTEEIWPEVEGAAVHMEAMVRMFLRNAVRA
ncbi:hypothetical protein [Streptomyces sp. NL15-2K]|uniref:hypothetical protein n=1 Tax=Streptomyces sp. NL15-2K TaxID=376149 RepID=UPI000F5805A3|nr:MULTISPECIES: hypothetical protein [Actinomycetes]WKX10240.1 hypothetical protein Q4V64_23140 [Kutzneria buriramensis]